MYIMLFLTAGTVLERFVPCTLSTFRGRCSAAIQYQVSITGSYLETAVRTNTDLLKKIICYKQLLYQDWKDGKITQQKYWKMFWKNKKKRLRNPDWWIFLLIRIKIKILTVFLKNKE